MVVPSTVRFLGISAQVFLIVAFPCIFYAVLVGLKVMIVVVNFALLQNYR